MIDMKGDIRYFTVGTEIYNRRKKRFLTVIKQDTTIGRITLATNENRRKGFSCHFTELVRAIERGDLSLIAR